MVEGRGETFQLVVFSSYKIEKCAPYWVEIIARLGALLEAARLRHRGGVGGREGIGGHERITASRTCTFTCFTCPLRTVYD
jgi:hypothetical protein